MRTRTRRLSVGVALAVIVAFNAAPTMLLYAAPADRPYLAASPDKPSADKSSLAASTGRPNPAAAPAGAADNPSPAAPKAPALVPVGGGIGPEGASAVSASVSLNMSSIDRLRLRVWGYPEITGEYMVNHDETISLPGIGRLEVGRMTPANLEVMLAERFSGLAHRDISVAVEVVRFKPFFIMGSISNPGAVEWQPGLNVIQAIALAGGVLRNAGGEPVNVLQQAKTQLRFTLGQLARLKAEKADRDSVEVGEQVKKLLREMPAQGGSGFASYAVRQNGLLEEQKAALRTRLLGLQNDRQSAERELQVAEAQAKAIGEQLEIGRSILADIEKLKDKQILTNHKYLTQRSEVISTEVRFADAQALVERARARILGVDRQIATLGQERQAALNERIEALEREAAQLEVTVSASEKTGGDASAFTYHIARNSQNKVTTFHANVFSEILPGDVLMISRDGGVGADPPQLKTGATSDADLAQSVVEASAVSRPSGSRPPSTSSTSRP